MPVILAFYCISRELHKSQIGTMYNLSGRKPKNWFFQGSDELHPDELDCGPGYSDRCQGSPGSTTTGGSTNQGAAPQLHKKKLEKKQNWFMAKFANTFQRSSPKKGEKPVRNTYTPIGNSMHITQEPNGAGPKNISQEFQMPKEKSATLPHGSNLSYVFQRWFEIRIFRLKGDLV